MWRWPEPGPDSVRQAVLVDGSVSVPRALLLGFSLESGQAKRRSGTALGSGSQDALLGRRYLWLGFFFFFPGRRDPCVAWWAGPPWESGLCRDASLRWRSSAFHPDHLPLPILPPSLSWSLFPSGTGLFGPPLAGAPGLASRWTTLCSPSFQQQSLHVHGGCGPSPGGGLVTMKFTI